MALVPKFILEDISNTCSSKCKYSEGSVEFDSLKNKDICTHIESENYNALMYTLNTIYPVLLYWGTYVTTMSK